MIKYFKELLETLKKIEQHLSLLSKCVVERHKGSRVGDSHTISTKRCNEQF